MARTCDGETRTAKELGNKITKPPSSDIACRTGDTLGTIEINQEKVVNHCCHCRSAKNTKYTNHDIHQIIIETI